MTRPPDDRWDPGTYGYGAEPPEPPKRHTGRTVGLAIAVIVSLVAVVFVGSLVARSNRHRDDSAADAVPQTVTVTTTAPTTETPTTTTTEDTTTTTTRNPRPGRVTYQLTGSGDVVAVTFRDGGRRTVVPAASAPWSQEATVRKGSASLLAIVVRGPVTCNIMYGDQLLSSSTSNGGPLSCAAAVPNR